MHSKKYNKIQIVKSQLLHVLAPERHPQGLHLNTETQVQHTIPSIDGPAVYT